MIGSLFSGIGGLDMGLEWAGFGPVAWHCEADTYCRAVLARHWPGVPCYPDIREVRGGSVAPVSVLCGGFPCQDLSVAGRNAGLEGARSGLWYEMLRLIRELRPGAVVVENGWRSQRRWVRSVRADLCDAGYVVAPVLRVRACDVGARHERGRGFVLARLADPLRSARFRRGTSAGAWQGEGHPDLSGGSERWRVALDRAITAASDAHRIRLADGQRLPGSVVEKQPAAPGESGLEAPWQGLPPRPGLLRGVHGVPGWLDGAARSAGWTPARVRIARIHALGNAVVPPVAHAVGLVLKSWMEATNAPRQGQEEER